MVMLIALVILPLRSPLLHCLSECPNPSPSRRWWTSSPVHTHRALPVTLSPPAAYPVDAAKLGRCTDLLGRPVHVGIRRPRRGGEEDAKASAARRAAQWVADVEAALCPCTAATLRANLLNIHLVLLVAGRGKQLPPGSQFPAAASL